MDFALKLMNSILKLTGCSRAEASVSKMTSVDTSLRTHEIVEHFILLIHDLHTRTLEAAEDLQEHLTQERDVNMMQGI